MNILKYTIIDNRLIEQKYMFKFRNIKIPCIKYHKGSIYWKDHTLIHSTNYIKYTRTLKNWNTRIHIKVIIILEKVTSMILMFGSEVAYLSRILEMNPLNSESVSESGSDLAVRVLSPSSWMLCSEVDVW